MTTFIFFQKAEWKRKMRELQGEHAAQKREVTLLGWSGGAGFPETSSYPTAPPSSTTTPLKPVGWCFVADSVPGGRPPINTRKRSAARTAASLARSRGLWAFSSEPNTCITLWSPMQGPLQPPMESCAGNLRCIDWSFHVWALL